MRLFEDYLEVIFKHEGVLSDHPNDPGGITKYGISLMFLKGIPLHIADIDHDGDIDGDDIRKLEKWVAGELYKGYFWDNIGLDKIENELLKLHLFDMGVNAGNKTAVKLLQNVLGVSMDGIIGKITIDAIDNFNGNIVECYANKRKGYYSSLAINNPKLKVFINGWYNRVSSTNF